MTHEDDYDEDDGITLTDEQEAAVEAVFDWLDDPCGKQHFRLGGCAGTGKTVLAKKIGDRLDHQVIYGAFTNKAAHVLARKGCRGIIPPTTIHQLIYTPLDDLDGISPDVLNGIINGHEEPPKTIKDIHRFLLPLFIALKERFPHEKEEHRINRIAKIFCTMKPRDVEQWILEKLEDAKFALKGNDKVRNARLIIIDEASVVTKDMADDLSDLRLSASFHW